MQHTIDYLGMALLAGGLSSIVLFTSLGGTTYRWWSPPIIGLLVLGVALLGRLRRSPSAARPSPCCRCGCSATASSASRASIGFIVGIALFGSVTYLPLYLQIVKGASPTASGLQMLPLMAGVLIASIGSGQLITRFGRYKIFPIIGTALMVVGLFLLSRLGVGTSLVLADLYMLVLGLGLGFVMQVLVLAVQNAVEYENLGVATSAATLFRSMGGTIGVPIFGAIFSNQLASELAGGFPPAWPGGAAVQARPEPDRRSFRRRSASRTSPRTPTRCGPCSCRGRGRGVGFALTWFLEERPLRETVADQGIGDSFATRDARASRPRGTRRGRRQATLSAGMHMGRPPPHRAGRGRPAGNEAWVVLRLAEGTDPEALDGMLADLRARGLVEKGAPLLTAAGRDAAAKLTGARRDEIRAILEDWKPDEQPEVERLIERFAASLGAAPPMVVADAR